VLAFASATVFVAAPLASVQPAAAQTNLGTVFTYQGDLISTQAARIVDFFIRLWYVHPLRTGSRGEQLCGRGGG
jgi:hypothetical protein